ncbi:MAG: hypothetical protein WBC51_01260 [Vicinamibacterales bacterium]
MIWFFCRGPEIRSCEVRLVNDGPGYELVIVDGSVQRTERFGSMTALLSREHELLSAWKAMGWTAMPKSGHSGRPPH